MYLNENLLFALVFTNEYWSLEGTQHSTVIIVILLALHCMF